HREHVDALDFWRQRRGPDGTGPVRDFLSALRHDRRLDSLADQSGFRRAIGRRLRRDRRRARRVSAVFSDGATRCSVSNFLLSALLRGAGGDLSWVLVFYSAV